ncbi:MAG: hypothetical protein H7288_17895 [Kineosporiaceae bacterium]|nr:hypothetical protein [Aeromicrobium sp.]
MSKKALRRVLVAGILVCGLLASQAASAAEDPNNPGLPDPSQYMCTRGACTQYAGVATVGFVGVERARQWAHVTAAGAAALVGSVIYKRLSTLPAAEIELLRELGLDDYDVAHLENTNTKVIRWNNYVYALSPEGSRNNFGDFPPTTVRTVAFGSIPAEVTIHISQLRDEENLPVPLVATTFSSYYGTTGGERLDSSRTFDTKVTGEVSVRLSDLIVDGVPVDLGTECKTVEPATLAGLRGKGFWDKGVGSAPADELPTRETWRTTPYYTAALGGLLSGTIDIPAFTGCGVGGDDLSPLLTAMASGPGNQLSVRQSDIGRCFPANAPLPCVDDPLPLPDKWHE